MSKIIVRRQEYANNGTHANEIEEVVKQNLIANTLSSATDIAASVGLVKSETDAIKESLSTKFKTHTYGSVTFAANAAQRLEVSFSIIPSTAKCVTPYFSHYSNSSELSTKFTVIKHTASWYISYTNPNPQYSANLLIDYIDA